jgi:predicted amidohydrolase
MNLKRNKRFFSAGNFLSLFLIVLITSHTSCTNSSKGSGNTENSGSLDSTIKVALLQINPNGANIEANLKKGDEYCRKAKSLGADIVLFPEMWSIGYSAFRMPGVSQSPKNSPLSFEDWKAKAVDARSEFFIHFQHLAIELNLAIVISYLEKWKGLPRNSSTVIDSKGNILMTYAKVHTCDFTLMEANNTPGDDFYVCKLPVRGDSVRIGIMICYDRELPESARILMLKGAELILTPNACTIDDKRINQFQTRAFENAVGVAMANYPKPFQNGHSCAFDSNGDKVFEAGEDEGIFIIPFDMRKIRAHREKTIFGNAFRRPHKYNLLISPDVDTIFIRNNGLGEKFTRENR